ncbi:hypothetical protein [Streptomyces fagopyri]|uniref:hypothetical protein n=1 Tax=Streptomyces fagopyri TaxID=2662397 RepID=UPI003803999F
MKTFAFTGSEDVFEICYGIPVATLGEGESLLARGHFTDRHVPSVSAAYYRRVWGYRMRSSRDLDDLLPSGTQHRSILSVRSDSADSYGWEHKETTADVSHAQQVALIDVDWLAREDASVQSERPGGGEHSRSVWRQLAAVAYGTARQTVTRDDQRDRWLFSEAPRGIAPVPATRGWTDRVTVTGPAGHAIRRRRPTCSSPTGLGAAALRFHRMPIRMHVHQQTPHPTVSRPPIVVLCGSTTYWDQLTEAALYETAAGRIVLSLGCNMKQPHPLWSDRKGADRLRAQLEELQLRKIDLADEVLVVNPGGYMGESTRREIEYALSLGKPIRYTHPA